ncbi:MAG TPA: hypothetical protein VM889_08875 [Candidatus Thermoplasmatota archaeon]|nr:hypothetical protein [Candidatus Thermoplasmatota archaeon]
MTFTESVVAALGRFFELLAFWRGYEEPLGTLALHVVGIGFYTLIVFGFYKTLSRRRMLLSPRERGEERDDSVWAKIGRTTLESILLPITSFTFVMILTGALFLLVKDDTVAQAQVVERLILVAMAVVAGVRLISAVNENAAEDLAKLVPLSLLGVFIVSPGFLNTATVLARFEGLWPLREIIFRYFLAFIALEVTVRLFRAALRPLGRKKPSKPKLEDDKVVLAPQRAK